MEQQLDSTVCCMWGVIVFSVFSDAALIVIKISVMKIMWYVSIKLQFMFTCSSPQRGIGCVPIFSHCLCIFNLELRISSSNMLCILSPECFSLRQTLTHPHKTFQVYFSSPLYPPVKCVHVSSSLFVWVYSLVCIVSVKWSKCTAVSSGYCSLTWVFRYTHLHTLRQLPLRLAGIYKLWAPAKLLLLSGNQLHTHPSLLPVLLLMEQPAAPLSTPARGKHLVRPIGASLAGLLLTQ